MSFFIYFLPLCCGGLCECLGGSLALSQGLLTKLVSQLLLYDPLTHSVKNSHIKQVVLSCCQAVTGAMDSEQGTPAVQGCRLWLVSWLPCIVLLPWAQPSAVLDVHGCVTSSYTGLLFFTYLLFSNSDSWHKLSVALLVMLYLWPSPYLKPACCCYLRCYHCLAFWPKYVVRM